MNYNKIDVGFDSIDKILHIADIHIRNYSRHKEYRKIFKKLYCEVDKLPSNSIIYIGGDIVHNKTDISPELIDLTTELLTNLADRRHTIIITGNHDANLNNSSRLDTLSPIIAAIGHPRLHYLKNSGIYTLADIQFVVFGIFDDPSTFIKANSFEGENKIALFHGAVNSSKTDMGYIVSNENLPVSMFDGYDIAMLGDIHKRQFVKSTGTVLFCGSLLQQNIGESVDKHGCAIWDVKTRTVRFIDFQNIYSQHRIEVLEGVLSKSLGNINSHSKIQLLVSETTKAQLQSIIASIKTKYPDVELNVKKTASDEEKELKRRDLVKNIHDVEYQNMLLEEYLIREHSLGSDIISEIKGINIGLNKKLIDNNSSMGLIWEPKLFEFDNMFSYGEGNSIDFSKAKGVIGIFAPNHAGKSAIFDAMMFCLFDRCSRTAYGKDVLNSSKDSFRCKLQFTVNNINYFIEKKGVITMQKGSPNMKVNINFWMLDDEGEIVSLNGEQRKDTNKNITNLVGEYDDFILTAMSAQNNNLNFVDKSQSDKKKLLAKYTDVYILENLYNLGKGEIKTVKILLKDFSRKNYSQLLLDNKESLSQANEAYIVFNEEKEELEETLSEHQNALDTLKDEIKPISDTMDIALLLDIKNKVNEELDEINREIFKYKEYIIPNKTTLDNISILLKGFDIIGLENKNESLLVEQINNRRISKELNTYKIKIQNKLKSIERLKNHEYDPNCKYCCNNEFVKAAEKAKVELINDKGIVDDILNEKNISDRLMIELPEIESEIKEYNRLILEDSKYKGYQSKLNIKISKCDNKVINKEFQLKEVLNDIEIYETNSESIIHNRIIKQQMIGVNESILESKKDLSECISDLQTSFGKIQTSKQSIASISETITNAHDLEIKLKAYDLYLDAMHRDGIPYEIISSIIPIIEDEVNEILEQIVDFTIEFNVDGKNIISYIVYGDGKWPLSITSGMEKFLSSLAIRVALTKISCLPRPNFLIIDEGFGNLDSHNLSSLESLFEYLKTEYDFIMIVSHIDIMKDMVDNLMEIDVSKGHSYIAA